MPERLLHVNGQAVSYDLQFAYPALANLTGQPATAFPVGFTRTGLPIGLQVIGSYLVRTSRQYALPSLWRKNGMASVRRLGMMWTD